jgi:monoamine oxidase
MKEFDVIIIGAGASGLMAAYELGGNNKKIAILEARERVGGRAQTIQGHGFSVPVETGAEFVHGKLPISLSLLDNSGIHYHPAMGKPYTVQNGKLKKEDAWDPFWPLLIKKLDSLENDMSIADFLDSYFAGEQYKNLRDSVTRFAQGFDAADPKKVSAISLRNEWKNDDDEHQYRIENGYSSLFDWLAGECEKGRSELFLSHPVQSIDHSGDEVIITCLNTEKFRCKKVLITVPLGIWLAPAASPASIQYIPGLREKQVAATQMGYGNVIKATIEFKDFFWENNGDQSMPGAGFIFSDAPFPTWWTQNPVNVPQLSGWLAGPPSEKLQLNEEELKTMAIESLSKIFKISIEQLEQKITSAVVTDWSKDPWALGGYSYDTVFSKTAKKIMMEPVNDKLFFAGEALYEGTHNGTIEAAFESGKNAAKMMW